VNAMHEKGDASNPGKLPRLVFSSNQQQQQQQRPPFILDDEDSEVLFPDSLTGHNLQGPLFV
jgi:hypothetical protein